MPINAPLANNGCFGCGPSNPIGLHLAFEHHSKGGVQAHFWPAERHQGWDGVMHGGLVTVLLDEAMAWAAAEKTVPYYTAKLEVRYRQVVPTNENLAVRGWITRDRGRTLETRAELRDQHDRLLAEGTGVYVRAPERARRELPVVSSGG